MTALHLAFATVEVACVALIVADRRAGERRLAWPMSLVFFGAVHASMLPIAPSEAWGGFTTWFVALPFWP